MKQFYRLFIFLSCCSLIIAQEKQIPTEHVTRERSYDVLHYKLTIDIDEKEKTCEGTVGIKFVPLRPRFDVIQLDAAEMNVTQVKLGLKKMEYHLSGETLFIGLDKAYGLTDTLNLLVAYSVSSPKKGLYFIKPDSGYLNKQWQVWSNGESEDNHFWFPCYDFPNDKASSEMVVTVNDQWTAISNGKLLDVKRDPKHHKATYHWYESKPHVSYLISLVAGEYVEVKDSWGTVPLSYYVYKHQKDDAMRSFSKTPKIMEFFSSKIGYAYPWEKYAQTVVQDYILGGEENVSATTLTDITIHDARAHEDYNSDGLVAHELAHQWWGDLVSFRDWSHAWLSEGFASYFDILFQEYDKGEDEAAKSIVDAQNGIVVSDVGDKRRSTVTNVFVSPNDLFNNRIYGKGACVLHMLRFILGDELYWKAINHYINKFAYQSAETNDFKIAIEEATGYNLYWFFDEWVFKPGYPEFEVKSTWSQDSRSVKLAVKQVQKVDSLTGIFKMPVEIEVWVKDYPQTYRVMIDSAEEEFTFPAYQQPQLVIFDKGSTLLKKIHFSKSVDEWLYQLQHAEHGIDRYLAAEELRWYVDSGMVASILSKTLLNDRFWAVRREAVYDLGDSKNKSSGDSLIAAYGDRDARVRAAVVAVLKNFSGGNVLKTLQYAFEKDSSYATAAGALRSLVKVDSVNARTYLMAGLQRDSYREGIRVAAIRALAEMGDDTAKAMIQQFTKYGIDRGVRIECLRTLSRAWKSDSKLVDFFIGFLHDPSFQVRRSVIEILGTLGNEKALAPLQRIVETETEDRLTKGARDSIAKIQEAQKNSH
jgi:aminopeptidase N